MRESQNITKTNCPNCLCPEPEDFETIAATQSREDVAIVAKPKKSDERVTALDVLAVGKAGHVEGQVR